MGRFFALIPFVVAFLFTGCISRGYIHGRTPTDGYNLGYAWGAGMLTGRQPPIMPDPMVQRVSPEHRRYAVQAASEPGWYSCNGWTYTPSGEAAYFVSQSVYTDYVTGQLRLTDTPSRPRRVDTDGSGRLIYPDPCFHAR